MTEPRAEFDDFETANKAFGLFSLDEREACLKEFAKLQYISIKDRFFEAVHRIVVRKADD